MCKFHRFIVCLAFCAILPLKGEQAQNTELYKHNMMMHRYFDFKTPQKIKEEEPVSEDYQDIQMITSGLIVKEIIFSGNTVFPDEELAAIAEPYLQTELASEKLLELKNKITQHYIDHGYVNSGAILPDQEIKNGVVRYEIKEGILQEIRLVQKQNLQRRYITSRLDRGISEPLNIFDLQEALKLLERNANVQTIQSTLEPGTEPGTSVLSLSVEESKRINQGVSINNYNPASIGSYLAQLYVEANNLAGWGEELRATVGWRLGDDVRFQADDNLIYNFSFSVPVTRWDTRLNANYSKNVSTVVTEELRDLNIENESEIFSFGIRHPIFRDLSKELGVSVRFNYKKAATEIAGSSFLTAPSHLSSVSFTQDWVYRTSQQVIAVYSSFDFGVDLFIPEGEEPLDVDSKETIEFVTWLLQAQYLRRLGFWDSQVLLKGGLRFADKSVPATEKFEFGGRSTVRGYWENTFTLDEATLFSAEYQVPVYQLKMPYLSNDLGDGQLRLSLFYDYARGQDKLDVSKAQSLSSVGSGVYWQINKSTFAELLCGIPLRKIDYSGDSDLQDVGIHFAFSMGF